MEKIFKQYSIYISNEKKLSRNTVLSYENDIKKYLEYLRTARIDAIEVTENDLKDFSENLRETGISASTVSRIISSIKSLYEFMHDEGMISRNPAKKIKKPKVESAMVQTISQEEMVKMIESVCRNSQMGLRDRAILEVLYGTGMKVSEIISIDTDDVDLDMEYINCRLSSSIRVIPLGKMSVESIRCYIEHGRSGIVSNECERALFVNSKGERLTRQGIWKIIKKCEQRSGIGKSVTPSTIRNSFAAHMIQNGADVRIVGNILGNSSFSCMQGYIDEQRSSARKEIKDRHPRG